LKGHGFTGRCKILISRASYQGTTFSRAEKSLIFVIPSGLQAARDLLFRLFQRPLSGVHNAAQLTTARFSA
jgi:hypothetical protein